MNSDTEDTEDIEEYTPIRKRKNIIIKDQDNILPDWILQLPIDRRPPPLRRQSGYNLNL